MIYPHIDFESLVYNIYTWLPIHILYSINLIYEYDEYRQYTILGDKLYDSFIQREEYHRVTVDEINWLKDNMRYIKN
jgi:hypothetical protein